MNTSSAFCLAGSAGVLLCSMVLSAEPTPVASLAIAVQMTESLAFRALCNWGYSVQLFYLYTNAGNIEPMSDSSTRLFFSGKCNGH